MWAQSSVPSCLFRRCFPGPHVVSLHRCAGPYSTESWRSPSQTCRVICFCGVPPLLYSVLQTAAALLSLDSDHSSGYLLGSTCPSLPTLRPANSLGCELEQPYAHLIPISQRSQSFIVRCAMSWRLLLRKILVVVSGGAHILSWWKLKLSIWLFLICKNVIFF